MAAFAVANNFEAREMVANDDAHPIHQHSSSMVGQAAHGPTQSMQTMADPKAAAIPGRSESKDRNKKFLKKLMGLTDSDEDNEVASESEKDQ